MWVAALIIMAIGFALSIAVLLIRFILQLIFLLLPIVFQLVGGLLKLIFVEIIPWIYRTIKKGIRRRREKKQRKYPVPATTAVAKPPNTAPKKFFIGVDGKRFYDFDEFLKYFRQRPQYAQYLRERSRSSE